MDKATILAIGIGVIANGAWFLSDRPTWSAFGWIVVALLAILIGLMAELVWKRV